MTRFVSASSILLVGAIAVMFMGCGETTSGEQSGVVVKQTMNDLPVCPVYNGKTPKPPLICGDVYWVSEPEPGSFYSCNCDTGQWVYMDLRGLDGSSCSVTQHDGHAQITCGDTSADIYDGEQGPQGEQGQQGPQGETGPQGPQGEPGVTCTVTRQASMSECGDGAGAVISCPDTTAYVCDGPQGPQGDPGPQGPAGQDGTSCTVADNLNGTYTITCGTGEVIVSDGQDGADGAPGADGASCSVADNGNGTYTIECGADTVTVSDGQDGVGGASCTITEGPSSATISCDDGTSVVVALGCDDADGDGYGAGGACLGPDCDDTVPSCTTNCADLDQDGVPDCNDDCVDKDADGVCDYNDCNDWSEFCGAPGYYECGQYCYDCRCDILGCDTCCEPRYCYGCAPGCN